MKIEDIQVVGKPLVLATPTEADELASRLWITFPKGYREYVTLLGEGILGGSFVRIYPPWRIEQELPGWRRRIKKYWFWDCSRKLLPKERAAECVILGDTTNGDELIFHPTRPNQLFILPRDSELIFATGADLLTAVEWMCASGKLIEPFSDRNFAPFDSRVISKEREGKETITDPEGESLDDITELAINWAKRHHMRELARKECRKLSPKGGKAKLLYEGVLFDGATQFDAGYGIAWRIEDKETGNSLGVFRWNADDRNQGACYEPAKN